jgi:ligand-binding sensor domain-containing protein
MNQKIFFAAAIVVILLAGNLFSAQFRLENWKNHTSYMETRSADVDADGNIWCGTSGGVFVYNIKDESYRKYDNINGLLSLDVAVVKYNPFNGYVYVASNEGYLDIYKGGENWIHVTDIKNSSFANKQIKDIEFVDGKAYIAAAFGISVLDTKDNVFLESVMKIGDFPANVIVNDLLIENGKIWAATEAGLAECSFDKSLSVPSNWKTNIVKSGSSTEKFTSLETIKNVVYSSTENKIFRMSADTLEKVIQLEDWEIVNRLINVRDSLYWTIDYYIKSLPYAVYSNFDQASRLKTAYYKKINGKPVFILCFKQKGMALIEKDSVIFHIPNSPASNNFYSMDVDKEGNLWVASGFTGILGYGVGKWNQYQFFSDTGKTSPIEYKRVTTFRNNGIIASSWGRGFSILTNENDKLSNDRYYTDNSPLTTAVTSDDTFFVTGESQVDSKGMIWIINYGNFTSGPLLVAKNDDKWYTFTNTNNPIERQFEFLAIDYNGTKWLGSNSDKGLYYYNERGTYDNYADDKSGILSTTNSGLPDNQITSLAIDKTGLLWIGTYKGLRYIAGTSGVINNVKINVREPVPRLLRDEPVNDIMVDAINNVWIATNSGVFILDPEQNLIENINIKNSPLISNKVLSLATDPQTGRVFIATDKGMSEASSLSVLALDSYNVKAYPQPFDPARDGEIKIEGLAENSSLKVLKVNGEYVRTLETTSRVVIWDGKDDFGNLVGSGIYLIVASSETLGNGAVAKIAVIRNQ